MSRWLVLCLYCDGWSLETDDMLDGAAKADEHAQWCRTRRGPSPFEGTGVGAA